ncbi:peptidylprolyl isomerase [Cohnella faecalis]|uniref:Peptidylprolyl isomerase n=1 Tax=Cohnella faecalis TaxID=2315694 RepID=A0A398CDX9_9BACL|nr:peptidylprolyl isomerase [Cohnella faecalis]RIE01386.1 peptidylprolyl isomerase [Cohnella faecalis]
MLHLNRRPYRRLAMIVMATVLLAALLAGCGKKEKGTSLPGEGEGTVIATYKDGGKLTEGEFNKYADFVAITDPQTAMYLSIPQFKEQFVQQYISQKAFAAQATDAQLKESKAQIDTFKSQLEDALKTQEDLKKQLDEKKITVDELVQIAKIVSDASAVMKTKQDEFIKAVKDEEIKAEFDKTSADYNIVTVRHILIATSDPATGEAKHTDEEALKIAKEVKDKLDKGGDWTALAKEYSDDTGSKETGGLYEKKQAKEWVAEFKDAANKQEIGKIGDPVKTDYGYHVMKVESREPTAYDKLSQTDKDAIVQTLISPKMSDFIQKEQEKLEIKVTLPAEETASPSASPSASAPASPSASPSAAK